MHARRALYDGKGNKRLEHDEWSTLITDLLHDRGEFSACAIRKTVGTLHKAKTTLHGMQAELLQHMAQRNARARETTTQNAGGRPHIITQNSSTAPYATHETKPSL